MLGWMMKRGDDAPTAAGGDTTQVDQPDTPAPVFAARALKSALFGPPPAAEQPRAKPSSKAAGKAKATLDQATDTPSKPAGILLTPGTGTSRRKRVSFGHEVPASKTSFDVAGGNRNTRLNEALEKANRKATSKSQSSHDADSDADWEEADEDDLCNHDMTLDLNEPHSQSGQYWKQEFYKYQEGAKVELDKLLKYKRLAKSYAREKDIEATELAELLRVEQERVINMERKIAENACQVVSKDTDALDTASPDLVDKLTKQTALAAEYRQHVQDLEDQLDEFLRDKDETNEPRDRRRKHLASPRTHKTLMETQRELRRARAQVKELGELREAKKKLEGKLKAIEQRSGGSTLASDDSERTAELKLQLKEARDEARRKDEELQILAQQFAEFRKESEAYQKDTNAVLERANEKVSELKKENKILKSKASELSRPERRASLTESEPVRRSTGQRDMAVSLPRDDTELVEHHIEVPAVDHYRDNDQVDARSSRPTADILAERPNLEKPKWQPFVPRSPRNRAYLGDRIAGRIENGGITPAKPRNQSARAETRAARRKSYAASTKVVDGGIDLLQNSFEKVGAAQDASTGQNASALSANTSRSKLGSDRRAAALARIEQRMAEKKQARSREGLDKENVRP